MRFANKQFILFIHLVELVQRSHVYVIVGKEYNVYINIFTSGARYNLYNANY